MNPRSIMESPPFDIENLTFDFLRELTKIHAAWIHQDTNGKYGDDSNWFEGRRLTAVTIMEKYLHECKDKNRCLKVPDCCCSYLAEITVQDLKNYIAYFSWVKNGKQKDNPIHIQQAEYLDGCRNLMAFCESLPDKGHECGYDDLLAIIDRRACTPSSDISNRRGEDHRGPASKYLKN